MALWRNIGGITTIAAGQTMFWEYSYPPFGRDVGVAIAVPNLLEDFADVELVALNQGVVEGQSQSEGALPIFYTVRIQNFGNGEFSYNLNIGDWQ